MHEQYTILQFVINDSKIKVNIKKYEDSYFIIKL